MAKRHKKIIATKLSDNSGFSLVEITFVIAIVAIVISTIVFTTQARLDVARIFTTKERMQIIIDAIDRYAETYGHLPCPAEINADKRTDNDYGWATGSAADYGVPYPGVGGNPSGTTFPKGNCPQAISLYTGSDGDIVKGMVPIYSLVPTLDPLTAVDGWGNRFTYIVAENYTMRENYDGTGSYTVSDIRVRNHSDTGSGYDAAYTLPETVYIIMSHGPNGHGAYRDRDESLISISTSSDDDDENTDSDNIFTQSMPVAQFYDDILISKSRWNLPDPL